MGAEITEERLTRLREMADALAFSHVTRAAGVALDEALDGVARLKGEVTVLERALERAASDISDLYAEHMMVGDRDREVEEREEQRQIDKYIEQARKELEEK
jgi:hypothetical protein